MMRARDSVERLRASYTCSGFGLISTNQSVQVLAGTNIFVGASYSYSGFEHVKTSRTRVAIDPNVRVRGNSTYAGFEDVDGPISVGEEVEVYEAEAGLTGIGRVTEIDGERELVYLSVDWSSLDCAATGSVDFSAPITQLVYLPSTSTLRARPENEWLRFAATPSLVSFSWYENAFSVTASTVATSSDLLSPLAIGPHIKISQSASVLKVAA